MAAYELDLHGRVSTGADRVAADLSLPGLELGADTVLMHGAEGQLVGWGRVRARRVDGAAKSDVTLLTGLSAHEIAPVGGIDG
ncbi:hypothetical protein [Streptomyces sp. YIM S03343]